MMNYPPHIIDYFIDKSRCLREILPALAQGIMMSVLTATLRNEE